MKSTTVFGSWMYNLYWLQPRWKDEASFQSGKLARQRQMLSIASGAAQTVVCVGFSHDIAQHLSPLRWFHIVAVVSAACALRTICPHHHPDTICPHRVPKSPVVSTPIFRIVIPRPTHRMRGSLPRGPGPTNRHIGTGISATDPTGFCCSVVNN